MPYSTAFPGNCRAYVYTGIYDAVTAKDATAIDKACRPDGNKLLTMFTVRDIKPDCFEELQRLGWEHVISYAGAYGGDGPYSEARYPMTMMVKAAPWME